LLNVFNIGRYFKENIMTQFNASDSILYFPTIEFRSAGWLKAALTVWDHVYRIVPPTYKPDDPYMIKQAEEEGFIRSIILEDADLKEAYEKFMVFYSKLSFVPAGLEPGDTVRIHKEKIDGRLYPILDDIAKSHDRDWYSLPSELVRGYMFYLSQTISERRQLVRGTDNADAWVVSAYFAENGNFKEFVYDTEAEIQYYNLAINDLIPLGIKDVPMSQIIEFVKKRRDEKSIFRNTLSGFVDKLAECESESHAKVLLQDYAKTLSTTKNDLRQSMDFCDKEQLSSIFAFRR
ncbi:MAG: DUF6236 family protein, partial [Candidatus Omnitrophota bacterium]